MTTFQPPDLDNMSVDEMIASVGIWYHTLDLGGKKTPGVYDMAPFVEDYRFPDLQGRSVLDVGASNGFFSFLFEDMGAGRVVATDLGEFKDHDYPRWLAKQELAKRSPSEIAEINWNELHGGFTVAHKVRQSKVERVLTRVYDLHEKCTGPFDLAFCSNVFVHLQNPVAAMESIREVVAPGGKAIFATPVALGHEGMSGAIFVGEPSRCAWWVPTPDGFVRMCEAAGFTNVEHVHTFEVARQHGVEIVDKIGVIHCDVGPSEA